MKPKNPILARSLALCLPATRKANELLKALGSTIPAANAPLQHPCERNHGANSTAADPIQRRPHRLGEEVTKLSGLNICPKRARSDRVHGPRLQIHKDRTWNEPSAAGLVVMDIDSL
ncbi:Hypothetical predicted protein [Prunus dulcis]|uniref:Uncharacterized protein n=1 Tax=Prunus dulcis TaxID=3755 RepID=A0A5E4EPB3_PRUDU|nr:Hypothetical predicted protein [Prunus dulcis]